MESNIEQELKKEPEELTNIMTEKLMDPTIVERYGTSMKMSMGREYSKMLSDRYEILVKEFEKINKKSEDLINISELHNFFTSYQDKTKVVVSRDEIEALFDFMDLDSGNEITIQEFILSYMVIEEKIRLKDMNLKQVIDEYTFLKEKNRKGIFDNQDEIINSKGISNHAEFSISILEASNIRSNNFIGRCNPYCQLEHGRSTQKTYIKEDTVNPIFNEDFSL